MAEREGDDPLLDERGELVGHARPPPLARTQDLESVPLDHPLPAVVGRAVDAERAAGGADADPPGQVDQLQPVAEEHVILGHAAHSFPPNVVVEGERRAEKRTAPGYKERCRPLEPVEGPSVGTTLGDSQG